MFDRLTDESDILDIMIALNNGKPITDEDCEQINTHGVNACARPELATFYKSCRTVMYYAGDAVLQYIDDEVPALGYDCSYDLWCCDVVQMAVQLYCSARVEYIEERDEPSELTEWMDYDCDC